MNEFSEPAFEHASVGQRLANYIIDAVAFYVIIFILFSFFGFFMSDQFLSASEGGATGIGGMLFGIYGITFGVIFLYYTLLEGSKGKTLGKMITKTRVVTEDGTPLTFGTAFMRTLCRIVPFEFISAFLGTRMWHDQWTKTMVVKDKAK